MSISAARISKAGTLLDGTSSNPGIVVTSPTGEFDVNPAVAFIGGQYWLSWAVSSGANSNTGNLYGARVSTAGSVLGSGTNGFRTGLAEQDSFPAIVGNASGGVMIWISGSVAGNGGTVGGEPIYPAGP
jgi:hypothetical protein